MGRAQHRVLERARLQEAPGRIASEQGHEGLLRLPSLRRPSPTKRSRMTWDDFHPQRDELTDWQSSVQREWEKWESLQEREDLGADWWPPKEDDEQ